MPSTLTHTAGERMTSPTALTSPATPPISAPRVVSPFQYIESTRIGKLTEAATPNVSATRKAMF
ncbi:hypothetical protein D3C76_1603870 [compost metagenome]